MRYDERPNFLDALFGLMLAPGETSEALLGQKNPPFGFTILLCLALSIFVPIFAQLIKYGAALYNLEAILSLFFVVFFAFLLFVMFEGVFLKLIGVQFELKQLFAISAYCVAPLLLALWLTYLFNYFATGRLSFLRLLVTGYFDAPDPFLQIVPLALLITVAMMGLVFFYCVRILGAMHVVTALPVTMLSILLLGAALVFAVCIGELAHPGTIDTFLNVLASPSVLTRMY